nr:hypothetical protein [Tawny frogmouth aviadenovirus A]
MVAWVQSRRSRRALLAGAGLGEVERGVSGTSRSGVRPSSSVRGVSGPGISGGVASTGSLVAVVCKRGENRIGLSTVFANLVGGVEGAEDAVGVAAAEALIALLDVVLLLENIDKLVELARREEARGARTGKVQDEVLLFSGGQLVMRRQRGEMDETLGAFDVVHAVLVDDVEVFTFEHLVDERVPERYVVREGREMEELDVTLDLGVVSEVHVVEVAGEAETEGVFDEVDEGLGIGVDVADDVEGGHVLVGPGAERIAVHPYLDHVDENGRVEALLEGERPQHLRVEGNGRRARPVSGGAVAVFALDAEGLVESVAAIKTLGLGEERFGDGLVFVEGVGMDVGPATFVEDFVAHEPVEEVLGRGLGLKNRVGMVML